MNATTAAGKTIRIGTPVILDLVGATGTVVDFHPNGTPVVKWSRSGKSFPCLASRLLVG